MVRYEIHLNRAGEYWWQLVAANNQIVCWSEGYVTKQAAIDSINWVKRWGSSVPIQDLT
ncbi:MAG: DUF1508 domain-containing protein [Candidatus Woesebacteria bacterium]|nr:MAG: DUF1508 domain-containing protein [Candidatus Woesebacteria bacterium]